MILVYSLIYIITRRRDDSLRHVEENLKESLKTRIRRIPGSRRKRTIDAEEFLDKALNDRCQGEIFLKCEGREGNSNIYRQQRLAFKTTWPAWKDHVASFLKDETPWLKHTKLDHVSKKKKRERKVKGHSDDVQHKGNGTVDGEGQV